jgi:hypothetical protein
MLLLLPLLLWFCRCWMQQLVQIWAWAASWV